MIEILENKERTPMKILITGGSGLFGQYLNLKHSKENYILTLHNNIKGNCNNFSSLQIDLKNYQKLKETFNSATLLSCHAARRDESFQHLKF